MTTTWKARPTTYRGIQMRSRLEARIAAALDRNELMWDYEPRAYGNDRGQYLPDFEIALSATRAVYFEAKPTMEAAFLAMERMAIIWDSEPDAILSVYADREGLLWSSAGQGTPWRVTEWSAS